MKLKKSTWEKGEDGKNKKLGQPLQNPRNKSKKKTVPFKNFAKSSEWTFICLPLLLCLELVQQFKLMKKKKNGYFFLPFWNFLNKYDQCDVIEVDTVSFPYFNQPTTVIIIKIKKVRNAKTPGRGPCALLHPIGKNLFWWNRQ